MDESPCYEEEVEGIRTELLTRWRAYESIIHYFQLLLIWEKPFHSVVFVSLLHLLFWYLKTHLSHVIGLAATIVLIILWLDLWKHKIWPEIRAREPDLEANEWGELHPRVLTFPEVCIMVASFYSKLKRCHNMIFIYRRDNPEKFVAATSAICLTIALLGSRFPGFVLAYLAMVCCLSWPVIWHHCLLEKAQKQLAPVLMQLQHSMKPRAQTETGAFHVKNMIDHNDVEVLTDSSSDEFSDIIGALDANSAEAFSQALEADDDTLSDDFGAGGFLSLTTPQEE